MISFKEYLLEGEHRKNVLKSWTASAGTDLQELINLLNTHCKDSLQSVSSDSVIYRADKNFKGKEWVAIDSSTGTRTSRDTNNIYQLMIETSEYFKHIPKRSNSIIGTTNYSEADAYSDSRKDMFVVLPFDGTTIAYTPKERDFIKIPCKQPDLNPWNYDLEDLSSNMGDFLSKLDIKRNEGNKYTNARLIDSALSKIGIRKIIAAYNNYMDIRGFKEDVWVVDKEDEKQLFRPSNITAAGKKLISIFEKLPSNERFTVLSGLLMNPGTVNILTKKVGSKLDNDAECWFSGKAIMVSEEVFTDILVEMKKQGMVVGGKLWYNVAA